MSFVGLHFPLLRKIQQKSNHSKLVTLKAITDNVIFVLYQKPYNMISLNVKVL